MLFRSCAHPPAPPPGPSPEAVAAGRAAVDRFTDFRDQMCACHDEACAAGVERARSLWLAASYGEVALSPDQRNARDDAGAAYDACATQATTPRDPAAEAIAAMKDIAARMCACRDAACVQGVSESMTALNERHKDTKATNAQMKEAMTVAGQIAKCAEQAMPTTP